MNIDFIDGMIMPIITAACLCIGFVMKKWMPTDDNRPLNQKIFTDVKNQLTHNRDRGRSGAAGFTSFQ